MTTPTDELTIERVAMRCPACNAEVMAQLKFKVTVESRPTPEGSPNDFCEVDLKHKLKGVKINHDCMRPPSLIRETSPNYLGTPIGGRVVKDNPQA